MCRSYLAANRSRESAIEPAIVNRRANSSRDTSASLFRSLFLSVFCLRVRLAAQRRRRRRAPNGKGLGDGVVASFRLGALARPLVMDRRRAHLAGALIARVDTSCARVPSTSTWTAQKVRAAAANCAPIGRRTRLQIEAENQTARFGWR